MKRQLTTTDKAEILKRFKAAVDNARQKELLKADQERQRLERAGIYRSTDLEMVKWQIEPADRCYRLFDLERGWISQLIRSLHPPNKVIEFYTCKNLTDAQAYHCHVCQIGEKPEGETRFTVCYYTRECWRRLVPRLYSNILLMIQVVNKLEY